MHLLADIGSLTQGDYFIAIEDFNGNESEHDLSLNKGEKVKFIARVDEAPNWILVRHVNKSEGFVPLSCVNKYVRQAQKECLISQMNLTQAMKALESLEQGDYCLIERNDYTNKDENDWNQENDEIDLQDLILCFNIEHNEPRMFKILNENGKLKFEGECDIKAFDDLQSFIEYYSNRESFLNRKHIIPCPLRSSI